MRPFKFLESNTQLYKKFYAIPGNPVWTTLPVIKYRYYYSKCPEYYINDDEENYFSFEQIALDYFFVYSWEEFLYDNRDNYIWIYDVRVSSQLSNYNTERLRGMSFSSSPEVPRSIPLNIRGKVIAPNNEAI